MSRRFSWIDKNGNFVGCVTIADEPPAPIKVYAPPVKTPDPDDPSKGDDPGGVLLASPALLAEHTPVELTKEETLLLANGATYEDGSQRYALINDVFEEL